MNLKTIGGIEVDNAVRSGESILGLVNGKPMAWDTAGRRLGSKKRTQKDLAMKSYLVIRKWAGHYSVTETTDPNKADRKGVVKIVEL